MSMQSTNGELNLSFPLRREQKPQFPMSTSSTRQEKPF